jgi:hypothetical protein
VVVFTGVFWCCIIGTVDFSSGVLIDPTSRIV